MKTKKLLLTVLSLLMVFALSIFVACKPTPDNSSTPDSSTPESSLPDSSTPDSSTDEVELSHISYHSGLDADAYVKGEDLDLSGLTITVHYTDGSSSEVVYNADDFAVSYDSNVPGYSGEVSVTIEYMEKTCEKTVVFGSKYQITEVGAVSSYANYLSVIGAENPIFTDVSDIYKVGDDNAFSVRPTVSGINNFDNSQHANIKDLSYVITVEKWVDSAYVVMEAPETDVLIDNANATVDFESSAIGGKYRISVYPDMLYEEQIEENGLEAYTATVEFEVVDGYNVYDLIGLSLIDNSKNGYESQGDDWKTLRQAAGVTVDSSSIHGIVLHANVAVTPDGIPSSFMFKQGDNDLNTGDADYERAVNSFRDFKVVFYRNVPAGEHFDIHGNYFNVDASSLPMVVRPSNKVVAESATVIPHATLMYIRCGALKSEIYNTTQASVNNLNCLGNLQLKDTNTTGGIIFLKSAQQKLLINNMVARQWYITTFPELSDKAEHAVTIRNNQYYDNYNCFVYSLGAYVNIENSIMKTCGGPVIIADNHYHLEGQYTAEHPNGWIPTINVDDESVLESWVGGTESWFVQMNANNLAAAVTQLDGLFQYQGGKSFIGKGENAGKMNLVLVIKSGSAEGVSFKKIYGSCNIGDLKFSMSNPIVQMFAGQSVLFQAGSESELGAMYINGTTQYMADAQSLAYFMGSNGAAGNANPITNRSHGVFSGEYLGIYLGAQFLGMNPEGYMGIVFGGYKAL